VLTAVDYLVNFQCYLRYILSFMCSLDYRRNNSCSYSVIGTVEPFVDVQF